MENVIKLNHMKKFIICIIIILGLIVFTNFSPINILFGSDECKYSNSTGSFTFEETNFGGYDYALCMNRFSEYKKQANVDTILFRLTSMNPLCFWKYRSYMADQKYRLPYKSWETIESARGPIRNKSGFQDF